MADARLCVVVYLAGLAGVPKELDEAAEIDGAGPVARFRYITWPMLAPACTINTVMLMISGFKVFDQIAGADQRRAREPGRRQPSPSRLCSTAFTEHRVGYASAMASLMLLIIAVVSVVVLRLLQRREVT